MTKSTDSRGGMIEQVGMTMRGTCPCGYTTEVNKSAGGRKWRHEATIAVDARLVEHKCIEGAGADPVDNGSPETGGERSGEMNTLNDRDQETGKKKRARNKAPRKTADKATSKAAEGKDTTKAADEAQTPVPAEEQAPNGTVDEAKQVYEWQQVMIDDTVPSIGCGWRYVIVEAKGKDALVLTETTGTKTKVRRSVFEALAKGTTARSNRAPRTPETSESTTTAKNRSKAAKADKAPKTGNRLERFMEVLKSSGGGTAEELAKVMGVSKVTVYCTASEAKRKGYPVALKDKRYSAAK